MSNTRLTGLYTVVAAAAAALLSPLLALSYFATTEGVEELEAGTVSGWAEPARDVVGGLLTWASPDRVYSTYVQLFALLFPAVFLGARAVRARRPVPAGGFERWSWRIALTGYGMLALGLLIVAVGMVGAEPESPVIDAGFMALMFPGMLIGAIGSTMLGIALLRAGGAPRITAWLLALSFVLLLAGSIVLGHNGVGLVPLFIAWAVPGWHMWRVPDRRAARTEPAVATSRVSS
jgi:hypothetical protein